MGAQVDTDSILTEESVVQVHNPSGRSPIVLVCEHASHHIPRHLNDLGLKPQDRQSHAAWDPGALAVALNLSRLLDAKLVASCVSRLVYDCNRPPEAKDAMPAQSEVVQVPGNVGLSAADKQARLTKYYAPFRTALEKALQATTNPVVVTIHSFTPIYHGKPRSVEIGVLHDRDTRLADAMLALAPGDLAVIRNAPYGPDDGVTHTLKEHAIPAGHLNVMLEIRNDLIATDTQQDTRATGLAQWLTAALEHISKTGHAA